MRKIPTLFKRVYENHKVIDITPEVTDAKCWTAFQLGTPTIKMDGSCCAVLDGKLYKRFDAKKGRKIPPNAIPCQPEPDPVTGHHPHWVLCDPNNSADKWFIEAYKAYATDNVVLDGTYEAVGLHFNGNPYGLQYDILDPHGSHEINEVFDDRSSRTFENVKEYLRTHYIEGIVFWYCGEPVCKIKRTDFGYPWGDINAKKSWLNELYGANNWVLLRGEES